MDAGELIATAAVAISLVSVYFSWRSSRSSDRSATAAEASADAARRTAAVDEANLEVARQERAAADLERRLNVWHHRRVSMDAVEFKFLGAEAHHVFFEANVVLKVERRKGDPQSPMYKGDRMIVVTQDPSSWNRRITVAWAESEGSDMKRLSKQYVI